MARSRTPSKKSKKAAAAGPVDLNDPMINLAVTVVTLAVLGCVGHLSGGEAAFNYGHLTSGFESGYLNGVFGIFGSKAALHATHWGASLVVTLHIMNSVSSGSGYWANQLVGCAFTAFGGLMMNDFLNNTAVADWAFWAHMPITIICWYLVNHNIPKTDINVWNMVSDAINQVVPLQRIMDLCTLSFNCGLLMTVAGGFAGTATFDGALMLPDMSKAMFTCVAVHCAGDFFNQDGFNFSISGCSASCERAVIVCFWVATNGLATLPFAGTPLQAAVGPITTVFGTQTEFLWMMILLNELVGDMIPVKPHTMVMDFLNDLLL